MERERNYKLVGIRDGRESERERKTIIQIVTKNIERRTEQRM